MGLTESVTHFHVFFVELYDLKVGCLCDSLWISAFGRKMMMIAFI